MKCRSCGSEDHLSTIIDLGNHAWCNDFRKEDEVGTESVYPLRLVQCSKCKLAQLDFTVPKEKMFIEHTYLSGTTKALGVHFKEVAQKNLDLGYATKDGLIVDIGGNDGTQLIQYRDLGCDNLLNVESATKIAAIALYENHIRTHNTFFNEEYVDILTRNGQEAKAKTISASGVFFHLEELHSVIRGIKKLLADDGVFVVQFMYFGDMVRKNTFDGIYHEHLCYYSVESLKNLLAPYGLEVFDLEYSEIHGGTMIARVGHDGARPIQETVEALLSYEQDVLLTEEAIADFVHRVQFVKQKNIELVKQVHENGHSVIGIGAPAKGNTLLTYFGFTSDDIEKLYETNNLKVGLTTPVTHIPIVRENYDEATARDAYMYVLSWNFFDEIRKKYPKGTKFILPFPFPMIVENE